MRRRFLDSVCSATESPRSQQAAAAAAAPQPPSARGDPRGGRMKETDLLLLSLPDPEAHADSSDRCCLLCFLPLYLKLFLAHTWIPRTASLSLSLSPLRLSFWHSHAHTALSLKVVAPHCRLSFNGLQYHCPRLLILKKYYDIIFSPLIWENPRTGERDNTEELQNDDKIPNLPA